MLKSSPECSCFARRAAELVQLELTNILLKEMSKNYGKYYMHYLEMFLGFLRTVILFFEPIVRYFWLSWIGHLPGMIKFHSFFTCSLSKLSMLSPPSSSSPWSSSSSASMPALKIVCIINTGNDGEAANLVKLPCRRRSQSTEYSSDSHTLKRTLMRNIKVCVENEKC